MKINIFTIHRLVVLTLVAALFSGCSSMQTMSSYARSGDTVMISLGGTAHNALVPVLKKENIQVSITDSLGNISQVKLRNLFKLHADQTSLYNYENKDHLLSGSYVDSYQGQWMAVVDLVDPVTGVAVTLSPGAANISVASIELDEGFQYYSTVYNGDLNQVPIEILDGVGSVNPMNYLTPISESPANYLESLPQVMISPQGTYDSANITVGGAEYVISYNNVDFGIKKPNVTTEVVDSKSQLAVKYVDQGDGTTHIKILLMNPAGFSSYFLDNNLRQRYMSEASPFNALNVSLYWPTTAATSAINDINWNNSIQLVSSSYVDTSGNPVVGLAPVLQKVR